MHVSVYLANEYFVATKRYIQKFVLDTICIVLLSGIFYLISCRSSKPVIRPGPEQPLLAAYGLWLYPRSGRDNVC
jgi:hypothetical protein